jgi:hypothetical protein
MDKTVNFVALVTAAIGALVAGFNAANYFSDRKSQSQQASFNNAVTLSKIYFEKLAVQADFCNVRNDANLLVAIITNLNGTAPDADLQSIALTMNSDFQGRVNAHPCPGDSVSHISTPATATGVVDVQKADLPPNSVYAIQSQVATNLKVLQAAATQQSTAQQPVSQSFAVYIQYHGDPAQAQALRTKINQIAGFSAPGVEQVAAVPNANEIRVYRTGDIAKAQGLMQALEIEARIVNLGNAFPNLPAGRMEIWLKGS